MIRGMVDRLAARLEQNPNDKEGWTRLAHAYDVLGETDKAEAARARSCTAPRDREVVAVSNQLRLFSGIKH